MALDFLSGLPMYQKYTSEKLRRRHEVIMRLLTDWYTIERGTSDEIIGEVKRVVGEDITPRALAASVYMYRLAYRYLIADEGGREAMRTRVAGVTNLFLCRHLVGLYAVIDAGYELPEVQYMAAEATHGNKHKSKGGKEKVQLDAELEVASVAAEPKEAEAAIGPVGTMEGQVLLMVSRHIVKPVRRISEMIVAMEAELARQVELNEQLNEKIEEFEQTLEPRDEEIRVLAAANTALKGERDRFAAELARLKAPIVSRPVFPFQTQVLAGAANGSGELDSKARQSFVAVFPKEATWSDKPNPLIMMYEDPFVRDYKLLQKQLQKKVRKALQWLSKNPSFGVMPLRTSRSPVKLAEGCPVGCWMSAASHNIQVLWVQGELTLKLLRIRKDG